MCTKPFKSRPRRDPRLRDWNVGYFVREETETYAVETIEHVLSLLLLLLKSTQIYHNQLKNKTTKEIKNLQQIQQIHNTWTEQAKMLSDLSSINSTSNRMNGVFALAAIVARIGQTAKLLVKAPAERRN